jgi:hypothetical protein
MNNIKDEAFIKFLEKIQSQNKADLALQALQVKYIREVAGEDDDKREAQLDKVAKLLEKVEKAVTGVSVKIDLEPVVNALKNQTQVLNKSLEEQTLMRKISEGSLEYDKKSAQYRNTSGRELTSDVSGKTVKQGGYVNFETAANRLQGQGKRVRESEANQISLKPIEMGKKTPVTGQPGSVELKDEKKEGITGLGTPIDLAKAIGSRVKGIFDFMTSKEVEKKEDQPQPGVTGINPEADNIQTSQEIIADAAKKDVELTKENNSILDQQLKELKKISAALEPKVPADLPEGRLKATPASAAAEESGGGLGLGDALAGMGGLAKKASGALVRGAKAVGSGALALGKGVARFAGFGAGKALGAAAAVGMGAYTAYKSYTAAEDSKQAKMEDIQYKLNAGEIDEKQAAELRKEAGNTATVEKSGAVGEGTGMAAGAIAGGVAGAKLGATIGTFVGGPVGTAIGAGIGALAGGALGAFTGTKVGKYVGEKVGAGINAVKGFFGFGEKAPGEKTKEAIKGSETTSIQFSEMDFAQKDPDNYKKFVEFRDKRTQEIAQDEAKKFGIKEPSSSNTKIAQRRANIEAIKKFQKEIESAGSGKVETKREGVNKEQQAITQSKPGEGKSGSIETDRSKLANQMALGAMGDSSGTPGTVTKKSPQSKTMIANEDVIPGKPLSEKQMMAIEMSKTMGNKYSPEIEAQYVKQKSSAQVTPVFSSTAGLTVAKTSTENADLTREVNKPAPAAQPIVSSSVNNVVNTQSFVPIKPSPRPERSGSALDRYNDRVAAY